MENKNKRYICQDCGEDFEPWEDEYTSKGEKETEICIQCSWSRHDGALDDRERED